MADLNPNIIMGAQPVQIQNPLDMAVKAMTMKDLMQKSQLQGLQTQQAQQEFSDNQAIRHATENNTSVDPDTGAVSINRSGMLKELSKVSPSLVPKAAIGFAQQDQMAQQQKIEANRNKWTALGQMISNVNPNGSTDPNDPEVQKNYQDFLAQAKPLGVATDQLPQSYDKNVMDRLQASANNNSLTPEQQTENALKKQSQDIQQQELGLKLKQNSATQNQETLQAMQALRGNPALQRAETNVLSAKNLNDLAEQLRDPQTGQIDLSKANPQQVSLWNHELLRMASGGSGSEADLENLKPGTPQYKMAELRQKLTGKVSGADAAPYLQQGLDYANTLGKSSQQFLYQNAKGVVDAKRAYLTPQDAAQWDNKLNAMKNGTSFFGDIAPGGQAQGGSGQSSSGSKYIPTPQEAAAELARRQKSKVANN